MKLGDGSVFWRSPETVLLELLYIIFQYNYDINHRFIVINICRAKPSKLGKAK
jgi:hypothetical protein